METNNEKYFEEYKDICKRKIKQPTVISICISLIQTIISIVCCSIINSHIVLAYILSGINIFLCFGLIVYLQNAYKNHPEERFTFATDQLKYMFQSGARIIYSIGAFIVLIICEFFLSFLRYVILGVFLLLALYNIIWFFIRIRSDIRHKELSLQTIIGMSYIPSFIACITVSILSLMRIIA